MSENKLDLNERLRQRIGRSSRTTSVAIRFTQAEAATMNNAAARAGTTLREWCRAALLGEARQLQPDPLWTETIANRMLLVAMLRPIATGQKMTPDRFDELVAAIKAGKQGMAQEVMAQYKTTLPKEGTNGE